MGETEVNANVTDSSPREYTSPRLVPMGSLHDLLAGGGTNCDSVIQGGEAVDKGLGCPHP